VGELDKVDLENLSNREKELVGLITEGLTNKEISIRAKITVGTVKHYIHNILTKLNLQDRREIIIYMLKQK
jgi:DNA-binding NarL/FixJ family response regulator